MFTEDFKRPDDYFTLFNTRLNFQIKTTQYKRWQTISLKTGLDEAFRTFKSGWLNRALGKNYFPLVIREMASAVVSFILKIVLYD